MLRRFGRQKYISLLVLLALLLPGCASRGIPVETTAPPTTVPVTVPTTEPATVPTTVPTVCAECLAWEAGMTFGIDEQYILSGTADAFPLTFEAEFTLEKEQLTRENSLLNNDTAYDATLAYLIDENGHPKVSFRWAHTRTAEQIAGDASGGIDPGEEGLLAAYDLTRCPVCRGKDRSAAGGRLDRVALWQAVEDVEPVGEYDYAFAVIGDTQSLNKKNPTHRVASNKTVLRTLLT